MVPRISIYSSERFFFFQKQQLHLRAEVSRVWSFLSQGFEIGQKSGSALLSPESPIVLKGSPNSFHF